MGHGGNRQSSWKKEVGVKARAGQGDEIVMLVVAKKAAYNKSRRSSRCEDFKKIQRGVQEEG